MVIMSRSAIVVSDANDSNALCRLCMMYHEYYANIFIPSDTFRICVEEAIHDLLRLKVTEGDGLPSAICHQCLRKLITFRDFKEMCIKSDIELRKSDLGNLLTGFKLKVEEAADPETSRDKSIQENTFQNDIQVTEVYVTVPDELAMENMCHVKGELVSTENVSLEKGEINCGVHCPEGDMLVTTLTRVAIDPLAVDTMFDIKVEDDVKIEDCSPNTEVRSRERLEECEGSGEEVGGGDALISETEPENQVDHYNNIGGRTGKLDKESDELGADRQGISQNQARDNHSCDPVHEETMQLEYSLANSFVVDCFTEEREKKQKKNIKFNASSNKFSQLNDSARFIRNHECEQLCHQVENISYPTEYICNYCSTRYSEKTSLAVHIIRHTDGKKLARVLPKRDISPRHSQNLLVKDRGNAEPAILETSNIPFTRKSSRRKNPRYPTEYLCNYCNMRFSEKNSLALHIKMHVDGMMSACILPKKDFQPRFSQNLLVKDQGNFESVIVEPFNITVTQKLFRHKNEKAAVEDSSGGENLGRELCNTRKLLFKSVKPREKALVKAMKCNECGKIFNKKSNLRVHSRIHSGVKPFKCNECEKTFTSSSNLKRHSVVHTGVKRFKCNECGKTFSTSGSFRRHSRIHSSVKPFKCNECERTFTTSGDLNRHSVVHTGVKRFKCKDCGKMFSKSCNLRAHSLIHSDVNPFKCKECEKTFTSSRDLNRHSVVHTGVKRFKCKECGKMFSTSGNFRIHSRIHSGVKPFKCNECERTFTTSGDLNRHSVVHTGVKRFKCKDCGKMFSTSSNLRAHSLIHSGVKPFKCNECEKTFTSSSDLNRHSVVHTGVKRFKCNECGKMFTRSGTLKGHSVIHTGVKPFKCNECGKMFSSKGSLVEHLVVHTGVKRFKCNECGKMFFTSRSFSRHSRIHSSVNPL